MASLFHIYKALEEEIECNRENPVYAPLYFPEELHRKAALEQDLAFWYGPRWEGAIPYTPAMRRYVQRLHEVGRTEPELLVAHAYTRYLGDLSGGQVLKKIAQKALELPSSGEGLAFFTFPNIDSATKFKQLYRARMNSLEMTPKVRQRVIEEAKTAFLLNIQVRVWLLRVALQGLQVPQMWPLLSRASRPSQRGRMYLSTSVSSPGGRRVLRKLRRMNYWVVLGGGVLNGSLAPGCCRFLLRSPYLEALWEPGLLVHGLWLPAPSLGPAETGSSTP